MKDFSKCISPFVIALLAQTILSYFLLSLSGMTFISTLFDCHGHQFQFSLSEKPKSRDGDLPMRTVRTYRMKCEGILAVFFNQKHLRTWGQLQK